jgi:hypothetical protein
MIWYHAGVETSVNQILTPPWSSPDVWQEVHNTLRYTIERHQDRVGDLKALARRIIRRIEGLDGLLEDICSKSCPSCQDSCCQRARVWFDFRDLLVMHLGGNDIMPGQIRGPRDSFCRYLSSNGCRLRRAQRPYVCTWYVCAMLKKQLMQRVPSDTLYLTNSLTAIKDARIDLENRFIRIAAQGLSIT